VDIYLFMKEVFVDYPICTNMQVML